MENDENHARKKLRTSFATFERSPLILYKCKTKCPNDHGKNNHGGQKNPNYFSNSLFLHIHILSLRGGAEATTWQSRYYCYPRLLLRPRRIAMTVNILFF